MDKGEINVKSDMRTTLKLLDPLKISGIEHIPFPGALTSISRLNADKYFMHV
jgi:hypothetical protein